MSTAAVRPVSSAPPSTRPARWSGEVASAMLATPTRIPPITSGSTDDGRAPARAEAGTTSSTAASLSSAAWVSSVVTGALAADAVRTFGPPGVATKAP